MKVGTCSLSIGFARLEKANDRPQATSTTSLRELSFSGPSLSVAQYVPYTCYIMSLCTLVLSSNRFSLVLSHGWDLTSAESAVAWFILVQTPFAYVRGSVHAQYSKPCGLLSWTWLKYRKAEHTGNKPTPNSCAPHSGNPDLYLNSCPLDDYHTPLLPSDRVPYRAWLWSSASSPLSPNNR